MPDARAPSDPRSARLDGAIIGVVIVLALVTIAIVIVPGLPPGVVNPSLDLVINAVATVVTMSVAVLGWTRYREGGEPAAAFQAAAFLVLATVNGIAVLLVVTGLDRQAGMTVGSPLEAPVYTSMLARTSAAALLVVGGIASLSVKRVPRGLALLAGSAAVTLVLIAVFQKDSGWLPPLWTIGAAQPPQGAPVAAWPHSSPTALGAATQALGAALFLWAAGLSRRLYRRDGHVGDGYLAVGLVFAAFSEVQPSLYPGAYAGLVTSGDLLRLVFDVVLLVGLQAQVAAHLADLRLANEAMARSREADAEHAALEERARLSRELHDGLAQDLWVAKLKTRRLTAQTDLGLEARTLAGELSAVIDAGLADAQHAVAAMRLPGEPAGTFSELMARCVDEFADRFGLRAEFSCEQPLPSLTARAQAEALRIAREALSNASRHADATLVRVRAGMEAGRFVIVVGDNGRGFDPGAVSRSAFGLASMRERAALIGGELRIDSRPHDGTRISLFVPVVGAPVPVVAGSR